MNQSNTFTVIAGTADGTYQGEVITGSITTNASGNQWSDNVSWGWHCQSCGAVVMNGSWHVCLLGNTQIVNQMPTLQTKPHRCPVCEGRGRVLFDSKNPYAKHSSVEDWPCAPCNASGIVWGY